MSAVYALHLHLRKRRERGKSMPEAKDSSLDWNLALEYDSDIGVFIENAIRTHMGKEGTGHVALA